MLNRPTFGGHITLQPPAAAAGHRQQPGLLRLAAVHIFRFLREVKVQKCPKMNFHPGRKVGESAKSAENALSLTADLHFPPKMTEAQSSNPGLQAFLAVFASRRFPKASFLKLSRELLRCREDLYLRWLRALRLRRWKRS